MPFEAINPPQFPTPIAPFSAPLVWAAASTGVIDFFSGKLDEAAIYDFALAPDRIARHYAAGAGK